MVGSATHLIASLQATEAIKLILGLGTGLTGRIVAFDALDLTFREFRLKIDPDNEVTWENRDRIEITELTDLCMPTVLEPPTD